MTCIKILTCNPLKDCTKLVTILASLLFTPLHAQENAAGYGKQPIIGIEHLKPTEEDRRITTTTIDLFYPVATIDDLRLALYAGVSATRATGEITQLTGELALGTLKEVTYESSATGFGPNVLAAVDIIRWKNISASLDASGAFIFYDRDFPAGAKHYNFMWRWGPSLSYVLNNSYGIGISYRWMHVSNGRGVSPENPSYEAKGFGIRLSKVF